MPQDVRSTRPLTPLSALAQRWWIAVVLAVLGGLAGVAYASTQSVTYTGEARVAVGSESLDARVVAGYSSAATQLASDVARYVNDQQAQASLAPLLGERAEDVSTISASPIADSSVVRIEVLASTREAATEAAQAVAQQLTDQVNAASGDNAVTLLQQYTELSNQVAAAQQAAADAQAALDSLTGARSLATTLDAARATAEQTTSALAVLEVQQQAIGQRYRNAVTSTPSAAGLRIVQVGQLETDDKSSAQQKFGLLGVVLGVLLALVIAVALDRRRAAQPHHEARDGESGATDPEPRDGAGQRTTVVDVDEPVATSLASGGTDSGPNSATAHR
ncbi:MAG: hypothetical protein ACRYF3_02065 [Janthinobacterium lividum]